MNRVIAYIDGYNLYHGLREQNWKRFYWLNLQRLSDPSYSLPSDPLPENLVPLTEHPVEDRAAPRSGVGWKRVD